ncbi:MAG: hypothetical protein LKKZDAJK_002298 [Candidatus Fervidibacter sp.]
MAKTPLRKVRDSSANDLTKGYRPTEDWSVPLEQILEGLPPNALDPPGRTPRPPEGNEATKGTSPNSGSDDK